ncbi:MAG TPA: hypothetical protein VKA54_04270 [Gemmatimonadaceae bacterium]|nr:hypothetical protein [Gemmatimonadaceae bacterium]
MAVPVLSLSSQVPAPTIAPSGRQVVPCIGQTIEQVTVYTEAPSVASLRRVPVVARIARTMHETTQPDVVERFLLFKAGDRCQELRRSESERILRAQPFIADADVFIVANDEGTVDAEVRTIDETAIVLGGNVRARSPSIYNVLFGNANLGGQGVYTSASWRAGDGFRDGFAGRLIDNQFLGRVLVAGIEGERAPIGGSWRMQAGRPFYTDLQRLAWRARTGESSGLVQLRLPDGTRPGVELQRRYFDVGAIGRVGVPGRLALFGLAITGDDEEPGNRLLLPDAGRVRDLGPVPRPYTPHHIARVNLLLGVRDIRFVRRRALDAITASQDVPLGAQLGLQIGRSSPILGAEEEDFFLAGDVYVGLSQSERLTTRLQLRTEGRRASGEAAWDGVLSTGRLTHQFKMNMANLDQLVIEYAGGFQQRTPFQLLLGVPEGGVRGYERSTFAGGQRLVARMEHRYAYGAVRNLGDLAVAAFVDAGRQWAGDVPFGVNTPMKGSLGVSLLASVPPRSARVWRADVAFPVSRGARSSVTLRFTNADRTAFVFRDPRDVMTGREVTLPSSIFAWP